MILIHRHGALYAEEYGWDETFEALVAEIAAKFIQEFDPKRERCWIAERDGEIVGCVFLVKKSAKVAKLPPFSSVQWPLIANASIHASDISIFQCPDSPGPESRTENERRRARRSQARYGFSVDSSRRFR